MTKLLVKNKKIEKSNSETHSVYNFGIPAHTSRTGLKTCPLAGTCATGCYAQAGAYAWSSVSQAYESRLEKTLRADFPELIAAELAPKLRTAERAGRQLVIRIHDSGDFYSLGYTLKWFQIMEEFPTVKFYAYTKMVPLFQKLSGQGLIPENFQVIYSEGGMADDKIDRDTERFSRVFPSIEELRAAGFADATENDLVAGLGDNPRIGLVYHGPKYRQWTTGGGEA